MSFLEQPGPPLRESHLPADLVLDSLKLNPTSPHFFVLKKKKQKIPTKIERKEEEKFGRNPKEGSFEGDNKKHNECF